MLFRLTRKQVDTGPWWVYPTVAAVLTVVAVLIAGARFIGAAPPLEIEVVKAPEGAWTVGPDAHAAAAHLAAEPPNTLEIEFAPANARGETLFLEVKGAEPHGWINDAPITPGPLGTLELPGSALKEGPNRILLQPADGVIEVALRGHVARTGAPLATVVRGGPVLPPDPPSELLIGIAALFAAVSVFALLTLAPGGALAVVGGLFLAGSIVLSLFNAWSAHRVFLSPGAAVAIAAVPLALVSVGTLVQERPALRIFLELFTVYLIGVPFHVAAPLGGITPAPLPTYIAPIFGTLWGEALSGDVLAAASTIFAAALAAGGALALQRAALQLVSTRSGDESGYERLGGAKGGAPAADVALILYAFGTSILSIGTQDMRGHGIAAFGVALALWGFSRSGEGAFGWKFDLIAGAGLGLATAARVPAVLALILGFLGVMLARPWRLPAFVAGLAPFAALFLIYDAMHFGGPLVSYYGDFGAFLESLNPIDPEAVAGLLLSPNRGLFIFSPGLLLAVLGIVRYMKRADGASIALAFFPVVLVLTIAARRTGWAGGFSYGPRLLTEAVPPLALMAACGVDHVLPSPRLRWPAWVLVAISIGMHAPHFFFPNDEWNRRYRTNLEGAAWRAPEMQVGLHIEHAAHVLRLR